MEGFIASIRSGVNEGKAWFKEPAPPVALEKTPPEAVNFTSLHPGVGLSYLDLWMEAEKSNLWS